MPEQLNHDILEFLKRLHLKSIRTGKLISSLNGLLFHDLLPTVLSDDELLLGHFWQNISTLGNAFLYSIEALKLCFSEDKDETLLKVADEIEKAPAKPLPGVCFHIGLSVLLYIRSTLSQNSAIERILKAAIVDVVQNPLIDIHLAEHKEVIDTALVVSDKYQDQDQTAIKLIEGVLKNSSDIDVKQLEKTFTTIINLLVTLQDKKQNFKCYENYILSHPYTFNNLIVEAWYRYFQLIEQHKHVPLLWHLAFLDMWLHEHSSIPEALPKALTWLTPANFVSFIQFCLSDQNRSAYLERLLSSSLAPFLVACTSYFEYIRSETFFRIEPVIIMEVLHGLEKPTPQKMHLLLESIDQARTEFVTKHLTAVKKLSNILLEYCSAQEAYWGSFFEIHSALERHFEAINIRRASYILFLHSKINDIGIKNVYLLIELMQRRFDLARYDCSPMDLMALLKAMAKSGVEVSLQELISNVDEGKDKAKEFVSLFLSLFSEVSMSIETEDRISLAQWIYEHLRCLDQDIACIIDKTLEKMGFNIPLLDNGVVRIFSLKHPGDSYEPFKAHTKRYCNFTLEDVMSELHTHSRESNALHFSRLDELIATEDWERFIEKRLWHFGYVPLLYHPFYGYGVFFTEFKDLGDNSSHLVIVLSEKVAPCVISFYTNIDLLENRLIPIQEWASEDELQKKVKDVLSLLKGSFLEDAIIEFVPVRALMNDDERPVKLFLDPRAAIEIEQRYRRHYLLS